MHFWMRRDGSIRAEPGWVVESPPIGCGGLITPVLADSDLRPIRGGEGADEMLRIAGKPEHVLERA